MSKVHIKFSILVLNFFLIYLTTRVLIFITQSINIYIPFELTFLSFAFLYFFTLRILKIKTVGRYILLLQNKYQILITFAILSIIILFVIKEVIRFNNIFETAKSYSSYSLSSADYTIKEISKLVDISALDSTDESNYINWLNHFGSKPEDYILKKIAQHQVIIIGEEHEQSNYLNLLKKVIPDLYKAGVRVIALEVCLQEDNDIINNLITSKIYDHELALQIGRHQPWLAWGWKEYWDILEEVWTLNNSLAKDQEKMRIIGLDSNWEMPPISLVLNTENSHPSPFYEKLRILNTVHTLPSLIYRDELMAKQIEDQIIKMNKKGVVWIGGSHSYLNYKQSFSPKGRMGFILHKKFGSKIFQIYLHDNLYSQSISRYIGNTINKSNFGRIGFDIYESPYSKLRDSCSDFFSNQPNTSFGDIAAGYIYLIPFDSLTHCSYISNFITPKMFIQEKPFYEGLAERSFSNADEVNYYFVHKYTNL